MSCKGRQLLAKQLLYVILLVSSCREKEQKQDEGARPLPAPNSKGIVIPRNTAILPADAYSDLFLDSGKLETFIDQQRLNDTLTRAFRNFYNNRNFQFAWFASDGLTEQALAFSTLYAYNKDSSTHRKWLDGQLDSLKGIDTLRPLATDPSILRTELQMTWRFIIYLSNRYPDEQEMNVALLRFVPARKRDPMEIAASILSGKQEMGSTLNPWYDALKSQLQKYTALASTHEPEDLPPAPRRLKKGARSHFISVLKHRLAVTGELMDPGDTTEIFDDRLEKALRIFQATHGLRPDGRPGPSTIRALHVPVIAYIRQILMNLERMIWMPPHPPVRREGNERLILINIPEFVLHLQEGQQKVFDMNIVVGKEGHSTVLFSGMLDRITFNPYWNVPASIVEKELLPEIEKNKHYLEQHQMEITGQRDGLPVVRQLPGPTNELGQMKFLFPNSFDIYLHDSPHKELFSTAERAYSHGCIRVADARKLADYLLQPMPQWNDKKIDSILATNKEETVKLQDPATVLICYFTCWKGDQSFAEFRKDIYGHDESLAKKLFRD
ncbi:L,D-transpeptidase family protein [Flavitalea sp. BT771]|uniref:L,D-transpeptidase family protein n=1 Tax=Flavitalea sp. BT771 TaxID=3063329 RepID=UPI0026E2BBD4|nr:L,D-transpeptidase family protein [Flavitalea sp. BT771]MDO6429334.1 L,D-transpeptidase family protein [Flavitalea sp. BT771]MDV6218538.1 L,D-transpeptidase family protein [Flavitalea sp. BT771]